MKTDNRFEAIDREASLWAAAAVESTERESKKAYPMTITEIGNITGFHPESADDLANFAKLCKHWNIRTNVSDEKFWYYLLYEEVKP